MIDATHQPAGEQASPRDVIAHSPAWAMDSTFDRQSDQVTGITHTWTAPTEAKATPFGRPDTASVQVAVYQSDDLVSAPDGIHLVSGRPRVWIPEADLAFPDTTEARRFARALVEACERIEGAAEVRS